MDILAGKNGLKYCQPGYVSGKTYTSLTKSNIITAVKADGPYLGNGRSIKRTKYATQPASNQYKVALVIAPGQDYHWYVQNRNGYWSHKRGLTNAINVDANNAKIKNPKKCSRSYAGLNYSEFCGFYMVTRK